MRRLVFEESRCIFHEKSDHLQFLAKLDHEVSNAVKFCRIFNTERCCADRKLLLQTKIAEIERVVLKIIESVHQDDSYKYARNDNFRTPGFRSKEPKTLFDSWVET